MQIEPIGFFHSATTYKYEVPRQGAFFAGHLGRIELISGKGFEQALRDLEGFERLWIIFQMKHTEIFSNASYRMLSSRKKKERKAHRFLKI